MSLRVTSILPVNNFHKHNINFNGFKHNKLRSIGYAITAAAILSTATSCIKNRNNSDVVNVITKIENTDSFYSSYGEYHYKDNKVKRSYHYLPKDENLSGDKYDWFETIYPDGRVEKDSMGYKIYITPKGERTSIHTIEDKIGNKITSTELPDGTKVVKTEYVTSIPEDTLFIEKFFRKDGTIKENKYYNKHLSDSTDTNSARVTEQSVEEYNENEILLYWESNRKDTARSEKNNIYDRYGRIIYDDIKNEKYQYKGKNKTPFRSVAKHEDCARITLYNRDGSIKKIFFKASDGTITKNR